MNRRNFLGLTGTFTGGALIIPEFLHALGNSSSLITNDNCLIFIQLNGGNDGLNTFIPFQDDYYYLFRKNIAIPKDEILNINNGMGFHPELKDFARIMQDGNLSVIQNVGYPEPNRSHFRSQEIWQTASATNEYLKDGWLGRFFDNHYHEHNPVAGVNIDNIDNLSLKGKQPNVTTLRDPNRYKTNSTIDNEILSNNPQLDFVRKIAQSVSEGSEQIQKALSNKQKSPIYPKTKLGKNLEWIAQLIKGKLNTSVYYTSQNGYDTHDNQIVNQKRNFNELNNAMSVLYDDLKMSGKLQNTTIIVFSEFGRRVKDNGNGTDHGTAAPVFIIGGNNNNKIIGQNPNLLDLDEGDLKYKIDFRSLYASLLEEKLNFNPKKIGINEKSINELFRR
jgi:uncharacterized protein (DUF1501 family)